MPNAERVHGLMWLILYVANIAVAEVYFGNVLQNEDPLQVLVVTVGVANLLFWLTQAKHLQSWWQRIVKQWRWVFLLNLTGVLSWGGFVLSLKWLEPAVVGVATNGVEPLLMVLLASRLRAERPVLRAEYVTAIGTSVGMSFLIWVSLTGKSAVGTLGSQAVVLGFVWSLVGGLGNVGSIMISKKLADNGWTPPQILSTRFWMIWFLAIVLKPGALNPQILLSPVFLQMAWVSVATLVLPLYFAQMGIRRSEPVTVAFICTLIPLFALVFQAWDPRLVYAPLSMVGVALCVGCLVYGVGARLRTT